MTHTTRCFLLGLAAAHAFGCGAPEDSPALGALPRALDGEGPDIESCSKTQCGANSPKVNDLPLGDLHRDGYPGSAGFSVVNLQVGFDILRLDVRGGEFVGLDLRSGEVRKSRHELVGARINMTNETGESFYIRIQDYFLLADDLRPGHYLPGYRLAYQVPNSAESDLCRDPNNQNNTTFETAAVLVADERYNQEAKTVVASGPAAEGWFTIACTGSALYKMILLGYDPEIPAGAQHATTPLERQATIKMLTADYCGTGKSFTRQGQALRWENRGGWVTLPATVGAREALWTHQGALCLDEPRLGSQVIGADVAAECPLLAPCTDPLLVNGHSIPLANWASIAEWQTFNP